MPPLPEPGGGTGHFSRGGGSFWFSTDPELEAKVVDVVGCIWTRPRVRRCCAATRNPRSRPCNGPRRSCRCTRIYRATDTRLPAARHPGSVRRPEDRDGQGPCSVSSRHRAQDFLVFLRQIACVDPAAEPPGARQLRRAQAPRGHRVAGGQPARPPPLHPDPCVLDEHGRDLVLHGRRQASTAAPTAPPATSPSDPRLHRRLERPRPPLHLDQDRRTDPRQGQRPESSNTGH